MAQDVKEVIPEVVETDPEGYHSIAYSKLTPHLIAAIQHQDKQYNQLRQDDAKLRLEMYKLKEKMTKLEDQMEHYRDIVSRPF